MVLEMKEYLKRKLIILLTVKRYINLLLMESLLKNGNQYVKLEEMDMIRKEYPICVIMKKV